MRIMCDSLGSSRARLTACGQVSVLDIWVLVVQVSTLPDGERLSRNDAWRMNALVRTELIRDHRSSERTQTDN